MALRVRSLRFKLAAWFVLVFFGIQAVLVVGVVVLRREAIRRSLDEDLALWAEKMVDNVVTEPNAWGTDSLSAFVPAGAGFELFLIRDEAGEVLGSYAVEDPELLPFSDLDVVPAGPIGDVIRTIRGERAEALTGSPEDLRLITLPFRSEERLYFFQAAVRDEALERFLGPFLDLVAIGVPVGLIAASIAAWTIAGRAVAPIHSLAGAASAVDVQRMEQAFDLPTSDAEIGRLADELNAALARLKERYDAQEQFIGNVAHQLKTPIAVVLTQAQVLKLGERSADRAWEFVDRTEVTMQRLGRLVESFLILGREDLREELPLEPVPINDVLLGCASNARAVADTRDVHVVVRLLEGDEGVLVSGDPDLLGTMFDNLVQNAVNHSPSGAEVLVEASIGREGVVVDVRDRGAGVPQEELDRIFDRFVSLTPRNGKVAPRGTGIGLAIVRTIATLHGGTVRAANRRDGGASFSVTLPVLRQPAPEEV